MAPIIPRTPSTSASRNHRTSAENHAARPDRSASPRPTSSLRPSHANCSAAAGAVDSDALPLPPAPLPADRLQIDAAAPGRRRRRLASPDPGRRRDSRRRPDPTPTATLPRLSRQSSIHIYDRRLSPPRALLTADPHPHRGQPRKPATTSSAGAADSLRRPHRRSTPRRLSPPRDPQRGQPNHIHTAVPGGEPPTTRICDFRTSFFFSNPPHYFANDMMIGEGQRCNHSCVYIIGYIDLLNTAIVATSARPPSGFFCPDVMNTSVGEQQSIHVHVAKQQVSTCIFLLQDHSVSKIFYSFAGEDNHFITIVKSMPQKLLPVVD
uniref:Uncharacterized protein n=1 Tax=Oryza nivara TaxID=4536 RepID=A0A0E0GHL1_ORYNI